MIKKNLSLDWVQCTCYTVTTNKIKGDMMNPVRLAKYNKAMKVNLTAEDLRVAGNTPYTIGSDETFAIVCEESPEVVAILGLYNETKNGRDLYKLASKVFKQLREQGYKQVLTTVAPDYADTYAKAFKFKDAFKVMTKEL